MQFVFLNFNIFPVDLSKGTSVDFVKVKFT